MKSETTLLEIYKWLSEGRKLKSKYFKSMKHVRVVGNSLVDNYDQPVKYDFSYPEDWEIYQEPVEKVKWFRVTSFNKCIDRPYISDGLYKSKEDYFEVKGTREDTYHWILLEEVKYE